MAKLRSGSVRILGIVDSKLLYYHIAEACLEKSGQNCNYWH